MKQQEQKPKPKRVEELEYFPFKSFQEFRKACTEGEVSIGVNRRIACDWAANGIHVSEWSRMQIFFWTLLPTAVFLGFIIYIIIVQNWWLIFALPLFVIAYFIFHPGTTALLGPIRSGLILLTLGALVWGFLNSIPWLTAFSFALALVWYSMRALYNKAVSELIRVATGHEDLLCLLWQINALNVRFYSGNSYWSRWKDEGGKITHYDLDEVNE